MVFKTVEICTKQKMNTGLNVESWGKNVSLTPKCQCALWTSSKERVEELLQRARRRRNRRSHKFFERTAEVEETFSSGSRLKRILL